MAPGPLPGRPRIFNLDSAALASLPADEQEAYCFAAGNYVIQLRPLLAPENAWGTGLECLLDISRLLRKLEERGHRLNESTSRLCDLIAHLAAVDVL